jgi:hypothetical protein
LHAQRVGGEARVRSQIVALGGATEALPLAVIADRQPGVFSTKRVLSPGSAGLVLAALLASMQTPVAKQKDAPR